MLTETDKQVLTKLIWECWHTYLQESGSVYRCSCGQPGPLEWMISHSAALNRSFTTWDDFGKVRDALVSQGLWEDFYMFATKTYKDRGNINWKGVEDWAISQWIYQLHEHFCQLVAEFMEAKEARKRRDL